MWLALCITEDQILSTRHSGKLPSRIELKHIVDKLRSVGVPQIILPCWLDTFDFANRVEYLGIGVYGSRKSAPRVESKELSRALMRVMGDGEEAARLKAKAEELAQIVGKVGGRVKACDRIIEILETS